MSVTFFVVVAAVAIITIYQIKLTREINRKIKDFETIFKNDLHVKIQNKINELLNYSSEVSFIINVIEDMIDRELDTRDEEISSSIPLPLYFGLGSTMLGIIVGLIGIISKPVESSGMQLFGISSLVPDVMVAMIGSLFGLVFTTFLSFAYKDAKEKVLREKNRQILDFQIELLKRLPKSDIKESMSEFSKNVSQLAESISKVSDSVLSSLQEQTEKILQNINSVFSARHGQKGWRKLAY